MRKKTIENLSLVGGGPRKVEKTVRFLPNVGPHFPIVQNIFLKRLILLCLRTYIESMEVTTLSCILTYFHHA